MNYFQFFHYIFLTGLLYPTSLYELIAYVLLMEK